MAEMYKGGPMSCGIILKQGGCSELVTVSLDDEPGVNGEAYTVFLNVHNPDGVARLQMEEAEALRDYLNDILTEPHWLLRKRADKYDHDWEWKHFEHGILRCKQCQLETYLARRIHDNKLISRYISANGTGGDEPLPMCEEQA